MTRKITEKASQAFFAGRDFKENNTQVKNDGVFCSLYLWGNRIAFYPVNLKKKICFTLAGWNTTTTRERLRGIGINIKVKKGVPFYNDKEIETDEIYDTNIIL
jgi:hypothetical protein